MRTVDAELFPGPEVVADATDEALAQWVTAHSGPRATTILLTGDLARVGGAERFLDGLPETLRGDLMPASACPGHAAAPGPLPAPVPPPGHSR
jgi:hypothetical protein